MKFDREEITPLQQRYLRVFAPSGHWTARESFLTEEHRAAEPTTVERSPLTGSENLLPISLLDAVSKTAACRIHLYCFIQDAEHDEPSSPDFHLACLAELLHMRDCDCWPTHAEYQVMSSRQTTRCEQV